MQNGWALQVRWVLFCIDPLSNAGALHTGPAPTHGLQACRSRRALTDWCLQSGTSHFLGQNFARAFDVTFQNKEQKSELVSSRVHAHERT